MELPHSQQHYYTTLSEHDMIKTLTDEGMFGSLQT